MFILAGRRNAVLVCQCGHEVSAVLTRRQALELELSETVSSLTRQFPLGSPCRYWPGVKKGPGLPSKIRSAFGVLNQETVVVWVEGHRGSVAIKHLELPPFLG